MSTKGTQKFVKGALVLSIAALIAKVLSAFFRVPLGNMIGDQGMAYYGYGYPIYTLLTSIAIVGIPSTIAKLVAERRVKGEYQEASAIFHHTMKLMVGLGIIVSALFFLGSQTMIDVFKWEQDTIYSLWGLSLSPIFICIMGGYRGYFQGMQNMFPTAISQVIENLGRVIVGLSLAYFFRGNIGKAAGGASFGAVAGGMCGALTLTMLYMKYRPSIQEEIATQAKVTETLTFKKVAKTVLWIAIPISIGAAVNSFMNFMDSAFVTARLIESGVSVEQATAGFGQLTKVATFINFPLTFGMALVVGLVPAIAEAIARKDQDEVQGKIELGSRFALLISLPAAVGLAALANPIMNFIYPGAPDGGNVLAVAALSIPFVMLGQAFTGILQGMGKVWTPVKALVLATVIKAILNIILVATPLRVVGAAIASIIGYAIFTLYNYYTIKKHTSFRLNITLVIIKPIIASLIMGIGAILTYKGLAVLLDQTSMLQNAIMTLGGVGVGAIVYAVVIFVIGGISKEDISELRTKKEK
ncbi:MAG: putative polysaccharide biosynthesis protein [Cellulosilyticaceae bacterium]